MGFVDARFAQKIHGFFVRYSDLRGWEAFAMMCLGRRVRLELLAKQRDGDEDFI